jgi:hypothetical protein
MKPRRAIVALLLGVAITGLTAPVSAAELPVREAEGVRVVRVKGAIVVVFTARAAKLYRRVAGRLVSVMCTEVVDDGYQSGGATQRAPKRRRPIRTGDLTRGLDYCRVSLPPRTIRRDGERVRAGRRVIVSIPLTQKGAVVLDEEKRGRLVLRLAALASIATERLNLEGVPSTAQMLDFIAALELRPSVVRLATPADTPPPGSVGYFGDGAERSAVVMLSASGRRLFFETEPDRVVRTNLIEHIRGPLP